MEAFLKLLVLILIPLVVSEINVCQPHQQIRVGKENGTLLQDGDLQVETGIVYPRDSFWMENDTFVLCPCKIGRCLAKCSSKLFKPKSFIFDKTEFVIF